MAHFRGYMSALGKPMLTRLAGKNGMRAGINGPHVGIEIEAVGDKLYVFSTSGRNGYGGTACIAIVTDPGASALDRKVNLNPYGEFTPAELGETVAPVGDPCVMLPVRYVVDSYDNEVTAYFPTILYDERKYADVVCYTHYGQHGAASLEYLKECRQATPTEYADLHAELTGIYDDVVLQVEAHNKS